MRQLDPDLKAHLTQSATTTCRCWKITRRDGIAQGFTEHDRELVIAGFSFEPASGFNSSVIESNSGFSADGAEVLGALTSTAIESSDLRAGKYDGARVEVYFVNWQEPSQHLLEHVLNVGKIVEEDGIFKATLDALPVELDQTKGLHFIRECQAELGDSNCTIDLNNPLYAINGAVTRIENSRLFETDVATQFDSGWYDNGQVIWETGGNAAQKAAIDTHQILNEKVRIKLWFEQPYPITIGDEFKLIVGCDKQFATCKSKFSNHLNFRGFPHLPGEDYALSYPDRRKPLDGGIIVE